MEKTTNERNCYLDTIKGLLVISIVFIHTCFHSGQYYIPDFMRNFALWFDVPLFFFVTGCIMSIYPKIDPLKQMYKLALFFFFGVLIFQFYFLHINVSELMEPIFFTNANIPKLYTVAASYWFVPVYIISLLYVKIITTYFKDWVKYLLIVGIPFYYIALWLNNKSGHLLLFELNIQAILFYIWLMLIGYQFFHTKGKKIWLYLSIIITALIGLMFCIIPHLYFQTYKFPVQLPYCILSLLSISIVMFLYKNLKNNIFAKIGKKALYYYFSQGIGAGLIIPIAKSSIEIWQVKFLLCFSLNLAITFLLGYIISLIYPKFEKLLLKNN